MRLADINIASHTTCSFAGITKFTYEKKKEKNSGLNCKNRLMYPIFIGIPASLSCITFSKAQDSGFRIPDSGKQQSPILLFKCIRNIGPKYNRDFLSIRETSYNLRGNGVILCVSKFNLNFVRNSFTYKCALSYGINFQKMSSWPIMLIFLSLS